MSGRSIPSATEFKVPPAFQPRQGDYAFDVDRALSSVVGLHSIIPQDAFTAENLGTERAGNGVLIDPQAERGTIRLMETFRIDGAIGEDAARRLRHHVLSLVRSSLPSAALHNLIVRSWLAVASDCPS